MRSKLARLQNREAQARGTPVLDRRNEEGIVEAETCKTNHPQKIRIEQHTVAGCLWFASWLFTIGYLHLHFWCGLLTLIIWPYYIGSHLSSFLR